MRAPLKPINSHPEPISNVNSPALDFTSFAYSETNTESDRVPKSFIGESKKFLGKSPSHSKAKKSTKVSKSSPARKSNPSPSSSDHIEDVDDDDSGWEEARPAGLSQAKKNENIQRAKAERQSNKSFGRGGKKNVTNLKSSGPKSAGSKGRRTSKSSGDDTDHLEDEEFDEYDDDDDEESIDSWDDGGSGTGGENRSSGVDSDSEGLVDTPLGRGKRPSSTKHLRLQKRHRNDQSTSPLTSFLHDDPLAERVAARKQEKVSGRTERALHRSLKQIRTIEDSENDDDVDADKSGDDASDVSVNEAIGAVDSHDMPIESWEGASRDMLQKHAQRVLQQCQKYSDALRSAILDLCGPSPQTKGGDCDGEGCLSLTSLHPVASEGASSTSSSLSSTAITDQHISQFCSPTLKLKDYQLLGVNWLRLCHTTGVNGVLADDMGLGKTVQTVTFLAWLKASRMGPSPKLDLSGSAIPSLVASPSRCRPHLIIVPASTLSNWSIELQKFTPSLVVHIYHGSQQHRQQLRRELPIALRRGQADIILSTYSIFERDACIDDRKFLRRLGCEYLVLDEAHCIKNANSQRHKALSELKVQRRLLLSGTPVQNHTKELLSLLGFLMPAVFPAGFNEAVVENMRIASGSSERSAAASTGIMGLSLPQLRRMLAPFVLRRVKADVLSQLTDKITEIIALPLLPDQAALYENILRDYASKKGLGVVPMPMSDEVVDDSGGVETLDALNFAPQEARHLFTSLRKAANHPLLLRFYYRDQTVISRIAKTCLAEDHFGSKCTLEQIVAEIETLSDYDINQICSMYEPLSALTLPDERIFDSPKIKFLHEEIPRLTAQGHHILIFSQWTRLLDILEILVKDFLELECLRLDGSTKISERQSLIDQFNTGSIPVFLLSTKAGGLGINLSQADTVFIHDMDFNPEADRQAEDRAHRIGQKRQVVVKRLYTVGTVDEDIYNMSARKSMLSSAVFEEQISHCGAVSERPQPSPSKADVGLIGRILQKALGRLHTAQ